MPVDVMKEFLNEGKYGSLHDYFYSTVGTGTTQGEARRMAKEIIPLLKEDHVDAVHHGLHLRDLYSLRVNDGKRI